ncbi:L-aspartate oxidase [Sporosarcina sp. HYO08]|uniref:L-aspartate oxidase n=1 Tax=Sporosarcina sp. HYO08 TaxID=1759557 RepID=UPI000793F88E|nr:L-aspartate oxidase [Sporosarcina sp. HYO08]KXH80630.1 L-aspartate oxidase [Sporosarcina sp. HYO08]
MEVNDVLIIGSGVAALQLATLLHHGQTVRMLTKSHCTHTNSYLAQGGIAAAVGIEDDPSKHIVDTLEAGRFHNNNEVVCEILNKAPTLIRDFSNRSEIFDQDRNGNLLLGLEGAHCEKRIVHSGGDATGKNVVDYLLSKCSDNITVEENVIAYELIIDPGENRCVGVKAKNPDGKIRHLYANYVILATGGCGQVYAYTSSAETITGDGIAMAYLAGVEIVDMEFIQFHPTLLIKNGQTKGLISEAVRGEGAVLVTEDGTPIMEGVHLLKDLAPRHIVAQTIFDVMESGKDVYLDIGCVQEFEKRFPTITAMCRDHGIDLSKNRIPVAPGSHYVMGGIQTDGMGRTSLKGLFAIGEASCTGFHGANRLASNSLLEGLYQGEKLAHWINEQPVRTVHSSMPISTPTPSVQSKKANLPDVHLLRKLMMKRVGIVRMKEQLAQQKKWLEQVSIHDFTTLDHYSNEELTSIFLWINAALITEAAFYRTESRGGHYRSDFPYEDDDTWGKRTIIQTYKGERAIYDEQVKASLVT